MLDSRQQLIAQLAIALKPLFTAAFDRSRIRSRPILDVDRERAGEFERAVMRLRRQRDDQVEIEPLPIIELLERGRLVGQTQRAQ